MDIVHSIYNVQVNDDLWIETLCIWLASGYAMQGNIENNAQATIFPPFQDKKPSIGC